MTPAHAWMQQAEPRQCVLDGYAHATQVLNAAGISRPRAVAIGYTARQRAMTAVETLRESFPDVPIFARAVDMKHAAELEAAGWCARAWPDRLPTPIGTAYVRPVGTAYVRPVLSLWAGL
jgi:hypothetical protein